MKVFKTITEFKSWRAQQTGSVGFVPTMGALHAGHGSLLKRACAANELCVLSIFVNPTQFNDPKDFEKYPNTLEADLKLAQDIGVNAVITPSKEDFYPDGYRYRLTEGRDSLILDGAHRPGHFDGVLTIVMKLFNVVQPTRAYFGEKDYQQLQLVKGMAEAFFMNLEVVPVPTMRETDGLAMSSRNVRLTPAQRKLAPMLYRALTNSKTDFEAKAELERQGFHVDYVEDLNGRRFAAAFLGDVRLIDNVGL